MPDKKDAKEKKQRKRSVRQKQKQQQNVIINVGEVKRRRAPARRRKPKAPDEQPPGDGGFRSFNMPAPQITYNFPASSNFGSEPAKATTVPIYDKKPTFANTMNPISLFERDQQTAPLGDIHRGDAPVQRVFNPTKHAQTDMRLFEETDTQAHVENPININREDNLVEGLGASMMRQPDAHREWVQPTPEIPFEVFGEPESPPAAEAREEPTPTGKREKELGKKGPRDATIKAYRAIMERTVPKDFLTEEDRMEWSSRFTNDWNRWKIGKSRESGTSSKFLADLRKQYEKAGGVSTPRPTARTSSGIPAAGVYKLGGAPARASSVPPRRIAGIFDFSEPAAAATGTQELVFSKSK